MFTPMIIANVFKNSQLARDCDFQTTSNEQALVVQFASSNSTDFAQAARLVAPYCSAVDLNCGCPQRWAIQERIGSYLMTADPQLIYDMVRETRNSCSLPVSVKIRIHPEDVERTVEMARKIEAAGAAWITVHARGVTQRSTQPPDWNAVRLIRESLCIPVIANGSIDSLHEAEQVRLLTGCNGVMAARGLLKNPGMFNGNSQTTVDIIEEFVKNSLKYGTCSLIFQQHLSYMMEDLLDPSTKRYFNSLAGIPAILDFLSQHFFFSFSDTKSIVEK